ncbi:TPA: DUF1456 family protein [Bacillus mobilis]|nr:DUF1456 family protein [Bacillus mobilis]
MAMSNNDILKRVRYALDIRDNEETFLLESCLLCFTVYIKASN